MIKPTYVTFEQAKLLKEKGFTKENGYACREGWINYLYSFTGATGTPENDSGYVLDTLGNSHLIERPEQWQVVEWLRVNHGINVLPIESYTYPDEIKNRWKYQIINKQEKNRHIFNKKFFIESDYEFQSPQEAYSAAFDYILNNLI
jgi:hypothetical protein